MIIKVLLIAGLCVVSLLLFRGKPSATQVALQRTLAILFLILGALAVMFPSAVTALANTVGVQRGTDLMLYAFVIVFLLTAVGLYRRLYELQENFLEVARHLSILEAELANAQASDRESR